MIQDDRILLLAGDEDLLSSMPEGRWIGGTTANFMTPDGGVTTKDKIFVTDMTEFAVDAKIKSYDEEELCKIGGDYLPNGFSVMILPGMSRIHADFAKEVLKFDDIFNTPLVGWISGVHFPEIGKRMPKCFAENGAAQDNRASVLHISLSDRFMVRPDIINLFSQGDGPSIEFDREGFATEGWCRIDGKLMSLAAYILKNGIDTKLPLVANYNDAMINVSIQSVNPAEDKVRFYAPVFRDVTYRFADPVKDYISRFETEVDKASLGTVAYSCNCILNYLYGDLEGKRTGPMVGPITFGEIAYVLLNQTLVYLSIEETA